MYTAITGRRHYFIFPELMQGVDWEKEFKKQTVEE